MYFLISLQCHFLKFKSSFSLLFPMQPTQVPKKSNAPSTIIHKSRQESIVDPVSKRHTNNIMSKLMRIASMQHGLRSCGSVIELSLDALSALAKKCSTEEHERFVHFQFWVSFIIACARILFSIRWKHFRKNFCSGLLILVPTLNQLSFSKIVW